MLRNLLYEKFGKVGYVIGLTITIIVSVMPLVAINARWWLILLILFAEEIIPLPLELPLWIWGLVHVIRGEMVPAFTIAYYIVFGIVVIYNIVLAVLIFSSPEKRALKRLEKLSRM